MDIHEGSADQSDPELGPEREYVSQLAAAYHAARLKAAVPAGIVLATLTIFGATWLLSQWRQEAFGTYSFLVGVPLVVAVLPYYFADRLVTYQRFVVTYASLLLVLGLMWLAKFEVGLCLALIALPWLAVAMLMAWGLQRLKAHRIQQRLRKYRLGSLAALLMPMLLAPLELSCWGAESRGTVQTSVLVRATSNTVWSGIVEVPRLTEHELARSWLQYLDVPRPVHATVDRAAPGGTRIGHFEGGVRFIEQIRFFEPERRLTLAVAVDPASLTRNDALAHALSSSLLRIQSVQYELSASASGATRLSLSCDYAVHTTVTFYAHVVTRHILATFQEQLLEALKQRFEHSSKLEGAPHLALTGSGSQH